HARPALVDRHDALRLARAVPHQVRLVRPLARRAIHRRAVGRAVRLHRLLNLLLLVAQRDALRPPAGEPPRRWFRVPVTPGRLSQARRAGGRPRRADTSASWRRPASGRRPAWDSEPPGPPKARPTAPATVRAGPPCPR